MTNLSPDRPKWRQRFSRDRVLIAAPVVAGFVAALALAAIDGKPRLERLSAQAERLEDLRRKQASLPGLIAQLRAAESSARKVEQEQAVLVDLIAGRDKIQTFLAQLSREALATGVKIELYEPVAQQAPEEAVEEDAPKDPLDELGYIKTSVLMQAQGGYLSLQAFLRRMESLQLLVQPSDLALRALGVPQQEDGAAFSPPLTQVNLRLSFFDRTADASEP